MSDELQILKADSKLLKEAIFGNPANIRDQPGIIAEQNRQSVAQDRTNEILMDLKKDVTRIIYMFGGALITGVVSLFVKLLH
jgi:hypothetical protein